MSIEQQAEFKDHQIAKLHNDLRDEALRSHSFQCLRERMVKVVAPLVLHCKSQEARIKELETELKDFKAGLPEFSRDVATEFYYWWHNQEGSNTQQGFQDWLEINKTRFGI